LNKGLKAKAEDPKLESAIFDKIKANGKSKGTGLAP
jgi:hypothetical protein